MKYTFETDKDINICDDCPCMQVRTMEVYCKLSEKTIEILRIGVTEIPEWCKLKKSEVNQ